MTDYIEGMIFLDPKYCIPKDPKEALKYIKEIHKPSIERIIEDIEESGLYFKMSDLDSLDELAKELLKEMMRNEQ